MLNHYPACAKSLIIATAIVGLWLFTLSCLLDCEIEKTHPLAIVLEILWQTFLDTGLFITAHEAMHGLICPQNPKLNHRIGVAVIFLYGFLSYKKLLKKHWLHHRYPATIKDPDFHNGKDTDCFSWYLHFLKGYWNWKQGCIRISLVIMLGYLFDIAFINIGLFWALPLGLSSLQLFYFGTFLPHRLIEKGYDNFHRANSINLPIFWSFVSCYHFGYHREHHEHPDIPWWQLPQLHSQKF
jgi:beta-carotene ketolase (CrtW type)